MITFKAVVERGHKRADGTFVVYIRMTYRRQVRRLRTSIYVGRDGLTSTGRLRDEHALRHCERLIGEYRRRAYELNLEVKEYPIDFVAEYVRRHEGEGECMSFTEWVDVWMDEATIKDTVRYRSAFRSFQRFLGKEEVAMEDVNVANMNAFARSLKDKRRARTTYTAAIAKMFREARERFNDEDAGVVRIRHSLGKFKVPRQEYVTRKRALTVEALRELWALPYNNVRNSNGHMSRRDLALDCFRLSFGLMGMNSVDLYGAEKMKGRHIIYNRQKTRDRRADRAEMRVYVHDAIRQLYEKYADEERVFNFFRRFSSYQDFNHALNKGLKEVGREIGEEGLTFYAARHTMATIAVNDVGIDKWTVAEMLCHTDDAMKVTDIYIKKDFTRINEAMGKVLEFVLGKKKGNP